MFARIDTVQRVTVSLVGAVFFAALFIGAAVPVLPIA